LARGRGYPLSLLKKFHPKEFEAMALRSPFPGFFSKRQLFFWSRWGRQAQGFPLDKSKGMLCMKFDEERNSIDDNFYLKWEKGCWAIRFSIQVRFRSSLEFEDCRKIITYLFEIFTSLFKLLSWLIFLFFSKKSSHFLSSLFQMSQIQCGPPE